MEENLHREHTLTIDQTVALQTTAARLEGEFEGVFGRETIEHFLVSSYDQFAAKATVTTFLPLLAERFARQRLHAFSRVEGFVADGKPVVLFLCVHNAGKSQMALGLFDKLAAGRAVAWSGGSEPGTSLNRYSVEAMAEIGIDITQEFPKPWTEETLRAADVIVTMGCGDSCPVYPGKRYLDWTFDAPPGDSLENVRPVRDAIEAKVRGLLAELGVEVDEGALASQA
ncbi:arsenate reductase ArsC [Demequina sp. TTPB684]|uniref:arsenate reductase ArsC n=1 Tax=unclassified Demequina TaxID=2620311 RepID=UPI001CF1C9A0|nr:MULTISPECIES: arsenate reductase ArsC [unclassified Demequina]MCB2412319.1 arsenate reductase ArsC [Demequina sp. TTPB684]UPU89486.1 arsenate reductase ArsC [Demequina sp. TMPB413]